MTRWLWLWCVVCGGGGGGKAVSNKFIYTNTPHTPHHTHHTPHTTPHIRARLSCAHLMHTRQSLSTTLSPDALAAPAAVPAAADQSTFFFIFYFLLNLSTFLTASLAVPRIALENTRCSYRCLARPRSPHIHSFLVIALSVALFVFALIASAFIILVLSA